MVINGRAVAAEILGDVKRGIAEEATARTLRVRAVAVAPNAATRSYLKIKTARAHDAGMHLEVIELPETATTEMCIAAVRAEGASAVIVQLPLPAHIDTLRVLSEIPHEQDADVLSPESRAAFERGDTDALLPPVVGAMKEIFARANVDPRGKSAVVIGAGWLVGGPALHWLRLAGASVEVITLPSTDFSELAHADIIVCGAGSPHLIRKEMLQEGVVLIDAGTSESDGTLVGDVHPECAEIASVFTPVPGGVGPIAVACLFQNALKLSKYNV